jgi:hypothetical protein
LLTGSAKGQFAVGLDVGEPGDDGQSDRVAEGSQHGGELYLGAGLPGVGVGFLATAAGLLAAVQDFAGVVAILCVAVLLVLARAPRLSRRPGAEYQEMIRPRRGGRHGGA